MVCPQGTLRPRSGRVASPHNPRDDFEARGSLLRRPQDPIKTESRLAHYVRKEQFDRCHAAVLPRRGKAPSLARRGEFCSLWRRSSVDDRHDYRRQCRDQRGDDLFHLVLTFTSTKSHPHFPLKGSLLRRPLDCLQDSMKTGSRVNILGTWSREAPSYGGGWLLRSVQSKPRRSYRGRFQQTRIEQSMKNE